MPALAGPALRLVGSRDWPIRRSDARSGLMTENAPSDSSTPSDAAGPPDLPARAQAGSRLHQALSGLSAQERWVLGLAYYRELTHAEIAAATQLPLGSVKSLITRAQHKLRAHLAAASEHSEGVMR